MKRNIEINGIIADEAESVWERMRGLIARPQPSTGHGLHIPHCNAIHTCFMGYAIDATFLDRRGAVVKTVKNVRPWRLFVWGGWRARSVLETAAND